MSLIAELMTDQIAGFDRLLEQVETMVRESGNPVGFNASAWLDGWMRSPVPALGGARPVDLVNTMEGQARVLQILAQMQSGAFA